MSALEELLGVLPLDLESEAKDFARFLSEKRARGYEGAREGDAALRDYRGQYASKSEQTTIDADGGHITTLSEIVQSLPTEMQQEVQDFRVSAGKENENATWQAHV